MSRARASCVTIGAAEEDVRLRLLDALSASFGVSKVQPERLVRGFTLVREIAVRALNP